VLGSIENFGTDSKGKYRNLEGKTTAFSLHAYLSAIGGGQRRVCDFCRLQDADAETACCDMGRCGKVWATISGPRCSER
jgi:hypothetical protein